MSLPPRDTSQEQQSTDVDVSQMKHFNEVSMRRGSKEKANQSSLNTHHKRGKTVGGKGRAQLIDTMNNTQMTQQSKQKTILTSGGNDSYDNTNENTRNSEMSPIKQFAQTYHAPFKMEHIGCNRDEHNQLGHDNNYQAYDPYVKTAIDFYKQRPRQTFNKFDGYMNGNAHEERFTKINTPTLVCGKFKKPRGFSMNKQLNLGIKISDTASSTVKENAFH
jgi:hypothetical protein